MATHLTGDDTQASRLARPERQPDNWRQGLPRVSGAGFTLRELSVADAPSLCTHLSNATVGRYIAQPPQSVAGFRTFVRWTRTQRRRGTHLCFGLAPHGKTPAVGIIQVWPIEPDFSTAEWGFAIGEPFWGTGLFIEAAQLVLNFAFETLGVLRLEARAVEANGRGNSVLAKLGAQPEGTLKSSFQSGNQIANHVMWAILAEDYHRRRQLERSVLDYSSRVWDDLCASNRLGDPREFSPQ